MLCTQVMYFMLISSAVSSLHSPDFSVTLTLFCRRLDSARVPLPRIVLYVWRDGSVSPAGQLLPCLQQAAPATCK